MKYSYPSYYYRTIPYRFVYWNRWIRFRVNYNNGYHAYNGYPHFVYNGYLHRYSSYDNCNFELVDGYTNSTIERFNNYRCNVGYDQCAELRSRLNDQESDYRYFCSEAIENVSNGNYDWDYDDDFYSDINYDDDSSDSDDSYDDSYDEDEWPEDDSYEDDYDITWLFDDEEFFLS
jgi:hypothetical protein